MNPQELLDLCAQSDVRLTRFLYCDNAGLIRGKATAMPGLPGRLTDGIGLTVAMQAMNSFDALQSVPGMTPAGEIRLVPDLHTFSVLPYAPHSAAMLCDMIQADRTPWPACPRSFLKRMGDRAARFGLVMHAAFEAEFILARKLADGTFEQIDHAPCFTSIAMTMAAAFADDLVRDLEAQGLRVEQYYPEAAHGQHELSIHHAEALTAADNHLRLRETIRNVAWSHGLYASLAPKPWPHDVGNGAHVHFSLWNEAGRNVFSDSSSPGTLSQTGRHFIGGLLAHLPALIAITCPSVNSYRRLQPGWWSSAFAVYGYDNREAAVRIASPFWSDPAASINLELKACDSSSNPYLALGCILAAGLDGIERQLDPGPELNVDPATLSEAEREARGIRALPRHPEEAYAALEADPVLTEALGPMLARSYLAVRRSEAEHYGDKDEDFEIAGHFYKY